MTSLRRSASGSVNGTLSGGAMMTSENAQYPNGPCAGLLILRQ
jgi:hypothetical protein